MTRLRYISKNYKHLNNAGNKAKTDIEIILSEDGALNAGLERTVGLGAVRGYARTLGSVIASCFRLKKGDVLLLQYPFKKYYDFVCRIARAKGLKTVTLIHDLGSFRRKKLTVEQEIKRLNRNDAIIVHTPNMEKLLVENGVRVPIVILEIFDYLSEGVNTAPQSCAGDVPRVLFAGNLTFENNKFLYDLSEMSGNFKMVLYGNGLDKSRIGQHAVWKGFCPSDRLICEAEGDYGLVWYGVSIVSGEGPLGEYVRYIAPHKLSLYIRCGMPVIVWKESGMAPFVAKNNIGLVVGSLEELDSAISEVTDNQYCEMKQNVEKVSAKLASGYYTRKAVAEALKLI